MKLNTLEDMVSTISNELNEGKAMTANLTKPTHCKPMEKPIKLSDTDTKKISYLEINIQRARNNGIFLTNTSYLDPDYKPVCCNHPHVPGRAGHNVPVDGLQCYCHQCRNNPHFRSKN